MTRSPHVPFEKKINNCSVYRHEKWERDKKMKPPIEARAYSGFKSYTAEVGDQILKILLQVTNTFVIQITALC